MMLAAMLAGCYEDKGNYDYILDGMNEIKEISFTPSISITAQGNVIEVQQALDDNNTHRRIEAHVVQTLAENYDNLHFYWYVSHTTEEGVEMNDTIETNGYLDITLPVAKEKQFQVYLQVYDNETTLSRYAEFVIKTRPIFKNSLFVLHGEAGDRKLGNIEVIGERTNIYTDAHGVIFPGVNPHKNAEGLSYTAYLDISYLAGTWMNKEVNTLTVFSSNSESVGYNPYGLSVKFQNNVIMKPLNNSFVFDRNIQTGDPSNYSQYRIVLSKDGQFCVGNHTPALFRPGYGNELNGGNSEHQLDYQITAATITENRYVMWDAKNKRFLYLSKSEYYPACESDVISNTPSVLNNPVFDAHVDFSSLEKSPENMRAVYAYIQYRENYSEAKPYFIFKDDASGEYWRYELVQLDMEDGKDGKSVDKEKEVKAAYSITGTRLRNFSPGDNLNTIVYNSWFTTNYLFYANGGSVYRYNVSNGDTETIYAAPDGYGITVLKFRVEDSNSFSGNLGRYLSIGMEKGTMGAVAEILLNTASDVDEDAPVLFYDKDVYGNSFGKIKDLQFVQTYLYELPDYFQ